jgi:uncharacterized membrane protein
LKHIADFEKIRVIIVYAIPQNTTGAFSGKIAMLAYILQDN